MQYLPLLLAMAASSAAAPDWTQAMRVEVELSSFKFAPTTLRLPASRPVALHLVNKSSGGHNFSAPSFFAAAAVLPADAVAIRRGAVEVKKRSSRDIFLVPAAGRYPLKCTHTLHGAFGMKGEIVVE